MNAISRGFALLAVATVSVMAMAGSYTVTGVTASFGKVSLPSTFSGYVTSAAGTSSGSYNTFTFKPAKSGSYSVAVLATRSYGANHTVRFQIFKGTVNKLASVDDSGAAYVSFKAGQSYTVKVQMISPSNYTTTRYNYEVAIGTTLTQEDDDEEDDTDDSSSWLEPPTPTASQGTYSYVKLSWSKVTGCKGYIIKRSTFTNYALAEQLVKISKAATTTYNDTSVKAGTTYYYWVCPLETSKTYWYNKSRYASGYASSGSSSGGSTSGSYISGSGSVTYKANSMTGAYYLYVNGTKVTSGVKWTKSGSGVTLSSTGGGVKLKMTTRPSGKYNVVKLNAKYGGKNYKKSVYIYK